MDDFLDHFEPRIELGALLRLLLFAFSMSTERLESAYTVKSLIRVRSDVVERLFKAQLVANFK